MAAMKELAVRKQNILVNVFQFQKMGQDPNETTGSFVARLKGQARVCNFQLPAGQSDYSEKMVTHQLISGLVDPTIQEQMLAQSSTNKDITLDSALQFIQAKEAGKQDSRHLLESQPGLYRISEFQKNKSQQLVRQNTLGQQQQQAGSQLTKRCTWCGQQAHGSTEEERRAKCKAFGKVCGVCGKANHFDSVCRSRKNKSGNTKPGNTNNLHATEQLGAGPFCCISTSRGDIKPRLSHHTFHELEGWVAEPPEEHPRLPVRYRLDTDAYSSLNLTPPKLPERLAAAPGLTDTGAQMCVAGLTFLHSLGCKKSDMILLESGISGANNVGLTLLGGVFVHIEADSSQGQVVSTKQLVYIAEGINTLFLSRSACVSLGTIPGSFPVAGSCGSFNTIGEKVLQEVPEEKETARQCHPVGDSCSCPRRTDTPAPPKLPFPATKENVPKLKKFVLEHYSSSCFNQCETQPLPLISGYPPLRLHIDPEAKPVVCHRPRPVPVHWQPQVKAELDRDVRLGVMEKVPVGTPAKWCAPMVLVAKHNGDPRRTVDFTGINKHSVRQTHPTAAPYLQAASIPANTSRTVLDAWQGYHSVPIEPTDADYTQFISPWGRYRYLTAPQGFLAAGYGYTNRFDEITKGLENQTRCIDDTALWDNTTEGCFHRTCEFLTRCGKAGIIFNKRKLQFAQEEIDFLGFRITKEEVKPGKDFVQTVTDFPRPRDITGVRSWFGLVNQLAFTFAATPVMAPFRDFLKPSTEFVWSDQLQEAFEKSKEHILNAIHTGVKIYDPSRTTALLTDWSKVGLGHILMQKLCICPDKTPR